MLESPGVGAPGSGACARQLPVHRNRVNSVVAFTKFIWSVHPFSANIAPSLELVHDKTMPVTLCYDFYSVESHFSKLITSNQFVSITGVDC